jgi:Insertion element 4 transposase N-terminal
VGQAGAGLRGITPVVPAASSLSRARRRLGSAPLRRLFEVLSGQVATPVQHESFYRGLRVVAVDGTTLSVPDEQAVTWRYPNHSGPVLEFG